MSFTTANLVIAKKFRSEPIEPPPILALPVLDTRDEFSSHSGFRVGVTHPTPVEQLELG